MEATFPGDTYFGTPRFPDNARSSNAPRFQAKQFYINYDPKIRDKKVSNTLKKHKILMDDDTVSTTWDESHDTLKNIFGPGFDINAIFNRLQQIKNLKMQL